MTKNIKLFAALLALALFPASYASAPSPAAHAAGGEARQLQQAAPAAQERRGLTPQEARGKAIYLRGESPSGREITATLADISVPAATVTCAGCHGSRGEGKTEGGITAGGLVWAHLTKPDGHTHPSGRKHGPFDEKSFMRSVTGGVDPSGNTMLVAMPRYRISTEDLSDVIAYLKRIEAEIDPGLTETEIKVGTILPAKGQLSETGAAMRDVLAAYFDDL
ncbi:MAG: c-type cytochrome, partial [Acidobacteria bacterium]|nr:c-type cytochrome [Acidobacteriota bacterium]